MRRRALVVFPSVSEPPVAVFAPREDGTLEEASVQNYATEEIRRTLEQKVEGADWEPFFEDLAARMPRPLTCEVVELGDGISPAQFLRAVR